LEVGTLNCLQPVLLAALHTLNLASDTIGEAAGTGVKLQRDGALLAGIGGRTLLFTHTRLRSKGNN
jgi:hypothetical protein